jgi:hypothetical protein
MRGGGFAEAFLSCLLWWKSAAYFALLGDVGIFEKLAFFKLWLDVCCGRRECARSVFCCIECL